MVRNPTHSLAFLVVCTTLFLYSATTLHRSILDGGFDDGFVMQLQEARGFAFSQDYGNEWSFRLLHWLRLCAVYPFVYCVDNHYPPFYEALVMLMFVFPIARADFAKGNLSLQSMLIFLPCALSYRASLVACGVTYLFMALFGAARRGTATIAISAILANLSSGSVMAWLLIVCVSYRRLKARSRYLFGIAVLMACGFAVQIANKIDFFSATATEQSLAGASILTVAAEAYTRSTLFVSYQEGQYTRLAAYAAVLCFALWTLVMIVYEGRSSREFMLFYLSAIPSFFVEGLSVTGFLIPVFWFYLGVRDRVSARPLIVTKEKPQHVTRTQRAFGH